MAIRQRDVNRVRTLLSQECARIMVEEGVKDFLLAKRKAAARLNVSDRALFPANAEIEQARQEYQRLFKSSEQPQQLRVLREAAVEAMNFLSRFQPRLVGTVLSGTAGPHSDVSLHLFAETLEEVLLFMSEHNIPFEHYERRVRLGNGSYAYMPTLTFAAGKVNIELTVFAGKARHETLRSPVDGRPMRRANLAELGLLLKEDCENEGAESASLDNRSN